MIHAIGKVASPALLKQALEAKQACRQSSGKQTPTFKTTQDPTPVYERLCHSEFFQLRPSFLGSTAFKRYQDELETAVVIKQVKFFDLVKQKIQEAELPLDGHDFAKTSSCLYLSSGSVAVAKEVLSVYYRNIHFFTPCPSSFLLA